MAYSPFVPLRVFSSFTMLEGAIEPKLIAKAARERLIEMVAEADEKLMERFFEEGTLSQEELGRLSGVSRQVTNRALLELQVRGAIRLGYGSIEVIDLNAAGPLSLYVDGADECDPHKRLIKGGGAALTREKIIAEASKRFVCIIDPSKQVPVLGRFPLPVEVIPMARSLVARQIRDMTGGQPTWREGVVTERFLEALWLEKGLSAHTQAAYRSDLEHFNAWLDGRGLDRRGRREVGTYFVVIGLECLLPA